MMYKAFAAVTLVAAPIIVLVVQSVAPQPSPREAIAVVQPIAPVSAPIMPPPPPMASAAAPSPEPAAFSQPMPDAGKPFLAPGSGLPGGSIAPQPPVEGESNDGSVPVVSDRLP